jgi:hypothetical protein
MTQTNLDELLKTDSTFLEDITDRDFIARLNGQESATNTQKTAIPADNPFTGPTEENAGGINPNGPDQTKVNVRDIVSGELATDLMDKILPVILSLAANRFLDMDVPKKNFTLTASEKSTIAPILDKCLSTLNISFENPFIALAMSLSFIYGSKFIDVANNPEMQKAVNTYLRRLSGGTRGGATAYSVKTPLKHTKVDDVMGHFATQTPKNLKVLNSSTPNGLMEIIYDFTTGREPHLPDNKNQLLESLANLIKDNPKYSNLNTELITKPFEENLNKQLVQELGILFMRVCIEPHACMHACTHTYTHTYTLIHAHTQAHIPG